MVTASGTGRFEPVDGTGFVGRAREQQVLESLFSSMKRGEGRLILIGGEAGIGKSSLVARFTKQAAEDGAIVLSTRRDHPSEPRP